VRLSFLPHSLSPLLTTVTRSPVEDCHTRQPPRAYHSGGTVTPLDIQGTDYNQTASPGCSRFSPVLTPSSGSSSPYPNTPPTDGNNAIYPCEPPLYDDWFHHVEEACTSIPAPPQRFAIQPQQQLPQNQHYYPSTTFPQDLTPPFPQHFTNYFQACNNAQGRPALPTIEPEITYPYPHNPLPALSGIDACMPSSQNENWNPAPLR
jgi:hypothetical protein